MSIQTPIGIRDYFDGYYNTSQVLNNLIYANSDAGIVVATPYGSGSPIITSNTVYQPAGDAIRIIAASPNVQLRNNLLWAQSGYDILVPADSEVGFQSDYNALYATGGGKLAQWEGRDFTSRADWFYELGFDGHSQQLDPLFANPAGVDGILGFSGGIDGGADDDFHLLPNSPAIDAGDPAADVSLEPKPNGGRLNLGNYGNTAEATISPAQVVQVLSPNGLEKLELGQPTTIAWRSSGLPGGSTVALELSIDSGLTWTSLVSGQIPDSTGGGTFVWSPAAATAGNTGLLRVRAEAGGLVQDTSDAPFLIANAGHDYYINDSSIAGDVFTTATGNNANSGKSPDQPMASLAALLALYDLDPGDVIHVDTGTNRLVRNVVITSQDSGVRIEGPATATAMLDRGNLAGGTYTIQLNGATGVTLDHLSITGAYVGVYAADGAASDHLTVTNCDIYGNITAGIQLGLTNDFPLISGNRIHDQSVFFASGIFVTSSAATISGNTLYHNGNNSDGGFGIWVNGADSSRRLATKTYSQTTGIHADLWRRSGSSHCRHKQHSCMAMPARASTPVGRCWSTAIRSWPTQHGSFGISNFGGNMEIAANTVHDNDNGISVGALAHDNRVYHNTHIGIQTGASGVVRNNVVYSNAIGIQDYFGGYYNTSQVLNNLIYANSDAGIVVATPYGSGSPLIISNTVYQPTGDAIRLLGGSPYVRLRDNILWVQSGYDIFVPADSEVGFQSDYNALVTTGSGKLGQWEGRDFTSRVDWFYELGFDGHSQTADPLFVNPAGADGILGYSGGADHGQDDDFHLQSRSPAIDAGNPADSFFNEPTPNGDRINLGNYGNTAEATTSPAQSVQVLSPNGLEKFEVGQQVLIQWRSAGLTPSRPVALINAGGPAVQNWLANSYQTIYRPNGHDHRARRHQRHGRSGPSGHLSIVCGR